MNVAIAGFGREGQSALKFLRKHPKYKRAEFWVLDKNTQIRVPAGVKKETGERYLSGLKKFDIVFRSPGIPLNSPAFKSAARHGVKISSATALFFEAAKKKGATLLGVTGSKGKTTTSTLIYEILKTSGRRVFFAGNVGVPMLDILSKLTKKSIVVLELSSFQLQDLKASPQIAVLLDVFPEHQDAHGSLKEYYAAKGNLCRYQKKNDVVFYFGHNPVTRRLAAKSSGRKISVGEKGFSLFASSDIRVPGVHQFRNTMMAALVAEYLKVSPETIRKVITGFKGVAHRLELIRTLKESSRNITFYNDSASTNPHTTASAVRAFQNQAHILIAGGYDKNLEYAPLREALRKSGTRMVVLFGANKKKIFDTIESSGVPVRIVNTLREAVVLARETAHGISGDVAIVFSPGAASFDMFKNYADRGEQFSGLVGKI